MDISICAKVDIGKERDQNEDAFLVCPDLTHPDWGKNETCVRLGPHGAVLVVADGMGGENAGEVASSLAIASIRDSFSTTPMESVVTTEERIKEFLRTMVINADDRINSEAWNHPETQGMGTTIVVCWIFEKKTYVAWCGDSRCYVYHPQTGLQALTKDHSFVQELIDKGELTDKEAFTHPDNHIITRGLGNFDSEAVPDIVSFPTQEGDTFLLCSDGLCGYCDDKTIEKVMKAHVFDTSDCCSTLINLALKSGGFDNICVALAHVGPNESNTKLGMLSKAIRFIQRLSDHQTK